jgi:hypothetical protein
MQSVFDHVDLYVTDAGNYVAVAYNGPERRQARRLSPGPGVGGARG